MINKEKLLIALNDNTDLSKIIKSRFETLKKFVTLTKSFKCDDIDNITHAYIDTFKSDIMHLYFKCYVDTEFYHFKITDENENTIYETIEKDKFTKS